MKPYRYRDRVVLRPQARNLIRGVPHRSGIDLTIGYPAFGPGTYQGNLTKMRQTYSNPGIPQNFSFREPTTSESVSAMAFDFNKRAKPDILDRSSLNLGLFLGTLQGIFLNLPKDKQGNYITDETFLKSLLDQSKEINGIYLLDNDLVYVPYRSFFQGEQEIDTFIRGGLARGLEYVTETEAPKLKVISSEEFYPGRIRVLGLGYFSGIHRPVLMVIKIKTSTTVGYECLEISADQLEIDNKHGRDYTFGILDPTKAA